MSVYIHIHMYVYIHIYIYIYVCMHPYITHTDAGSRSVCMCIYNGKVFCRMQVCELLKRVVSNLCEGKQVCKNIMLPEMLLQTTLFGPRPETLRTLLSIKVSLQFRLCTCTKPVAGPARLMQHEEGVVLLLQVFFRGLICRA